RLTRLATAQALTGDADAMRDTIRELQGDAAGDATRIADALVLLGRLENQLGNRHSAYEAFERADAIDPHGSALSQAIALADASQEPHRAATLRARLCARTATASGCPAPLP